MTHSFPPRRSADLAEHGLPWHDKAAEAQRALRGLLVWWVRFCTEESMRGLPTTAPADNVPSLARWLLHVVHGLTLHELGSDAVDERSEEHTSELQSLMRISYAVFCLNKKKH